MRNEKAGREAGKFNDFSYTLLEIAAVTGVREAGEEKRNDMINSDKFSDRFDTRTITVLLLWYFWSACTLFMNKYIIDYRRGDSAILSCVQMTSAIVYGYAQQRHSLGMYKVDPLKNRLPYFTRDLVVVGCLRFATVFLGLYALKYVEVSFTETVKSTAPAFTLIISSLLLGEKTSSSVKLSIVPVMAGLALCSANEAKFNYEGFFFALATNLSECLQNVISKKMLNFGSLKYNAGELQFHTALTSLLTQLPTLYLFSSHWEELPSTQESAYYILNGLFFHMQTLCNYALMDAISPVTQSVANTLKRALLIMLSVLLFHNTITLFSGLGTATVIMGVLLYNKARQYG